MKECVLVAGGAGYIGTHTAVELIEAGYDVVIVDNLSNSEMKAVEGVREITGRNVPFERVDCDDRQALAGVFDRYRFGAVIHFAASKAVGESVEKPLLYYRNNILSLLNVLDLMREKGVRNLVFSSSCTVYGQPEALPVTEQTPRQPATSPYGNTKQICEDILRDTVAAYPELCGIALRYFNPIGAHPSALIGELPKGVPGNLVPFITQTAAGIRECLSVFGDDYDTPDGSAIRDYIDVVDLAKAHVVAVGRMIGGKGQEPLRILQYRYGSRPFGTGTRLAVRTGYRRACAAQDRRPPDRRHREDLGRYLVCEPRARMEGRAVDRGYASFGLGLGETAARNRIGGKPVRGEDAGLFSVCSCANALCCTDFPCENDPAVGRSQVREAKARDFR